MPPHRIRFQSFARSIAIRVNQEEIKRDVRLFDEPLTETHMLPAGEAERLSVHIQKEREPLFGQKYRVFVNERFYKYYERV